MVTDSMKMTLLTTSPKYTSVIIFSVHPNPAGIAIRTIDPAY